MLRNMSIKITLFRLNPGPVILSLLLVAGLVSSALASGIALIDNSTKLQGNSYAGAAAVAEDASTVYFNPAGMMKIEGREVMSNIQLITSKTEFKNSGSTTVTTAPLTGGNGGQAGSTSALYALFFVHNLGDLAYGLGINSPFGTTTEYDSNWVGRYYSIDSTLITTNINPSIAYQVTDKISIGGGINVQYIDAEVSNAIDFGTLDDIGAFAGSGIPANALGLTAQQDDGLMELKGDDWSFGYNAGLLTDITDNTRIGLSYRSEIKHTIEGDADFTVPAAVEATLVPAGQFADTDAEAEVVMPASVSLSVNHDINEQWSIMADMTWTEWSSMPELRFDYDSNQADGVNTLNWEDSYRYSMGITYRTNEKLTLRIGAALDESPVPGDSDRSPRIPDEDRIWASLGGSYKFTNNLTGDLAYSHLFVDDPVIRKTATGEDLSRGALNGEYKSSADNVSAQINYRF